MHWSATTSTRSARSSRDHYKARRAAARPSGAGDTLRCHFPSSTSAPIWRYALEMDLDRYLHRIGLASQPDPTLDGLRILHRAQAFAVPYEAADVHLGRPVSQNLSEIFDKIVNRGRGGWCYEVNGLLGWALQECGFTVRRATGGVFRRTRGAATEGNHVALIVSLKEGEFIADLGVSDFLREPLPLREGEYSHEGMRFSLRRLDDGWWRATNDPAAEPEDFDFWEGPADETLIAHQHDLLRRDPDATFVQNFAAFALCPGGADMVVGRVFGQRRGAEVTKRLISGPEELDDILRRVIGIAVPDVAAAWPRILSRHAEVFGAPDALP